MHGPLWRQPPEGHRGTGSTVRTEVMSLGGAALALERLDCTHHQDQQQGEQQECGSDVGQSTPLCKERRARLLLPAIAPEVHSARLVVQDDCPLRALTVPVATRLPRDRAGNSGIECGEPITA